ncbi:hypothetical protein Pcinc_014827 [Petrolisthes cinctipes]|uniref:KRAB-A domain-containing protein 2 n=1 Tax=Petrolisthes cinctipes TaxID=88211 RepID=A0AAE1FVK2_PETCI|nr:hypothetical protein Pcinc_014827 [Petrolisthes cinctipes]
MACSQEAQFYEKVMLKKNSDSKSLLLTKIEYYNLIEELKVAASAKNKSNRQYYILGRYEVLQCGGVEKLIKKRKDRTQEPVYFVHIEDMFDTIKRAHIATGHGGRDKMVKDLSRYANGSVERLNCDIKDMLISWLSDNDTSDWPMGLKFVQFQKNTSYHSGIKQSPYKALFGVEARVGLRSTALPEEVLKTMITEEDLLGAYSFPSDSTRPDDSLECTNPPDASRER